MKNFSNDHNFYHSVNIESKISFLSFTLYIIICFILQLVSQKKDAKLMLKKTMNGSVLSFHQTTVTIAESHMKIMTSRKVT